MSTTSRGSARVVAGRNTESIQFLVLYEDFSCGAQAVRTLGRVREILEPDFKPVTKLWRLDLLCISWVAEAVLKEALAADVIVIAARETLDTGFLPETDAWFDRWIGRKGGAHILLVGLLDCSKKGADTFGARTSRLRQIARLAEVELLMQTQPWDCEGPEVGIGQKTFGHAPGSAHRDQDFPSPGSVLLGESARTRRQ